MSLIMMAVVLVASAFTPNTKWPYLMEQFQEGTLYRGADHSVAQFNIHFKGNVLHYINPKDEKIYEAKQNDMDSVVIAGRKFVIANRMVMEVVAEKGENLVLKLEYADFGQINKATGAYGSSANSSSVRQVTSIEMSGLDNPKHGLLLQEKNDGSELYICTKYYLRVGKTVVEADKKDIEKMLSDSQKDAWKQFLKKNKIKWKNVDSLVTVLGFFE